jgi:hypothetical protein
MAYRMRYSREGTVVIFDEETGHRWDMYPDEADLMAFMAMRQSDAKHKQLTFTDLDGYLIEMELADPDKDLHEQISTLSSAARQQLGQRPN